MARELLESCLERYPTFHGVVAPYMSLLLSAGVRAEDAIAEVERRVRSVTPEVRLILGSALQDAGALPAAERQYRSVLAGQPGNGQARVALAETLLLLGDNAGAASQAALVSEDDTSAGVASGIELCALISGGNPGAASDAFARARTDLSEVEREVFGTWLAITSGVTSPSPLTVPAVTFLKQIMETLLRARNVEQFELLLPALENSDLPTRQRRQLLGDMYLRHGYLAAAAKSGWRCAQTGLTSTRCSGSHASQRLMASRRTQPSSRTPRSNWSRRTRLPPRYWPARRPRRNLI